jgi:transcription elongation factor GreB
MSRYRPPRSAGTALITPEGEARMRAEFHELWHVRRPQVTQSVSEAAAQGDRSENAEYTLEPHPSYYFQYSPCKSRPTK